MAKKITSGFMAVDRDHAATLKYNGLRSQSLVEFDLVWDTDAGKINGDYTEIIVRLGSEEMDVQIPEGARWFWMELLDVVNEISRRAERTTQDAA